MKHPFGWDYPAGAEHDPNAPWNQTDEHHFAECPASEDSPYWDDPACTKCDGQRSEGICYLFEFLPKWLARYLGKFKFFWGRFPSYCNCPEPECTCDDHEEPEPDWDEIADRRRGL